jgi:DNA-binding GntR family transcriptional regulator
MKAVTKKSAEEQALEALRNEILLGKFAAGSRFTETGLAEALGVSRATVRTALHHLVQDGLVLQIPYSGWAVAALSARDAWELYTLRATLERMAAELACEQPSSSREKAVRPAFEVLAAACASGSMHRIVEADFRLHLSIVECAKHRKLLAQYLHVERQVRMYIAQTDSMLSPTEILQQHEPLVASLLSGQTDLAVSLIGAHTIGEGEALVRQLELEEHSNDHATEQGKSA